MNHQQHVPKPPRIAEWLAALFVPADCADAVAGDLQEEFSSLAISAGALRARAWYRRQAMGTISIAIANAFSRAPLQMFVTLAGGLWLLAFTTTHWAHAMRQFLDARQVYLSNPSAYLFWLKFPLEFGRVLICAVLGAIVALVAKRCEMPAVLSLALAQIALFCGGALALIFHGHHWFAWFMAMAPWNLLCAMATTVGGMIVRALRRPSKQALHPQSQIPRNISPR